MTTKALFKTSALKMRLGGQHHAPAALARGKTRYPLYRRLGGPRCRSGRVRKIFPPPGFDPRTVQPVDSRYTDWAIPASSGTNTAPNILLTTAVVFMDFVDSALIFNSTYDPLSVSQRSVANKLHTFSLPRLDWGSYSTVHIEGHLPHVLSLNHWHSALRTQPYPHKLFVIFCACQCGVTPHLHTEFDVDTFDHFDVSDGSVRCGTHSR